MYCQAKLLNTPGVKKTCIDVMHRFMLSVPQPRLLPVGFVDPLRHCKEKLMTFAKAAAGQNRSEASDKFLDDLVHCHTHYKAW